MRTRSLRACGLAVATAACITATAVAGGALAHEQSAVQRPLVLGFGDDAAFTSGAVWYQRAIYSGASVVRISTGWAGIAATKPAEATNPADPAYNWTSLDQQIRGAVSYGLTPVVTMTGAPAWAVGTGAPASATPGTWRPDAKAYGQFAQALGTRYSGTYPDPLHPGSDLPRVIYWEPWNEPNLSLYLAPQWTRSGHHWVAASPIIYRGLLNAFYTGLTSTLPQAQVIAGGTAPFGDPPGGQRIAPVVFDADFLCLAGASLRPASCPNPPHFDILDHHPYSISGPYVPALDPNDVSIADMGKLSRVLAKAEHSGRALPAGPKPLWVLEVSWNSSPPNPGGVPMATYARWVEEALYELSSEDVGTVSWYLIEDQPPIPSYDTTYQSGMYFLGGQPKLAEQAFRFPLIVDTRKAHDALLWTRVPLAGTLVVSRVNGSTQTQLFSMPVSAGETVERKISSGHANYIATVAGQSSLEWTPSP